MVRDPITRVVLADGRIRYKVVADVGADPSTGRRRQRRGTFTTVKDARSWLADVRSSVDKGAFIDQSRVTLADHLDSWLAGRLNLRASTRQSYEDALRPFRDQLGAVPLQALTKQQVEAVRNDLISGRLRSVGRPGAALAPRTVRMRLGVLQAALDAAMREGLISRNVAALVERPAGPSAPGAAWTAEQAERFLNHVEGDRLYAAWLLTMHGLRRGEVAGLRWSDVDWTEATISITRARVTIKNEVFESLPKTARGVRVLPLPDDVAGALRALQERQAVEARQLGPAYTNSGYVLVDEVGIPVNPNAYSDRFQRLAREAGVPLIRLHDARHTSVSLKRSQGWPDHLVAAWHGHDEAVMRATYTHSYLDDLRRHAGDLGRARGR